MPSKNENYYQNIIENLLKMVKGFKIYTFFHIIQMLFKKVIKKSLYRRGKNYKMPRTQWGEVGDFESQYNKGANEM